MLVRTWLLSIAAVVLAAAACAGDGTGLDPCGNPDGTGNGCGDSIQFARDVQPLFTANCAFSGCHAAGAQPPQQGMNLSPGQAYANIVGIPSRELPAMQRVRPLLPESSYLVHKIQGTQLSVGGSGERMPLGGALTTSEIERIRGWILLGAKNN